ncbi:MAG: peptide deformylase [Solirubrobacterales bacterium]
MAILKIARMGHPVLRRPAAPVADPTAPEIQRLIDDMIETMVDAGGAGLAAPQVHVGLRVVIFHAPALRNDGDAIPLTVLINPSVETLDDGLQLGYEGCLSVPGMTGEVPRFRKVRYRGLGRHGEPVEREAEGFHARVVQHECDHLDGLLYPMRMRELATFGFVEEVRKALEEEE